MKWLIGIDEAGRGPVLGPLVIAGLAIREEEESWLGGLGVRDSKLLTRKKREALREELMAKPHALRVFTPGEIDRAVEGSLNLNGLEALGVLSVLGRLLESLGRPSHEEVRVFIDAPSSPATFKHQLLTLAADWLKPYVREARVEPGADNAYRVVGGASILAKTERDRLIHEKSQHLNLDLGSGYPADPKTRKALEDHHEKLKGFIRESWRTAKRYGKRKTLRDWKEEK